MSTDTALKPTALTELHRRLGAKMVPFAGFIMPVFYSGIVSEHRRVRESVGMFDVSHMGEVTVKGPNALDFVQRITINDASTLSDGQAQYSAMCQDDGGIIDDLLVYRRGPDDFLLVINASNIAKDFAWMKKHEIDGAELTNISDDITLLAVQGPDAERTLQKLTDVDLASVPFYHFVEGQLAGTEMIISRTGYTGEKGFELYLPSDVATSESVWNAIMEAGEEFGIEPIGLGARDTLRMEMGFCLYGNDITEETNPVEARLGWITKLDKGDFIGHDPIAKLKEEKPERRLTGFVMQERGVPRQGYEIVVDDEVVGEITSGTMSPTLGAGIGLGYIRRDLAKSGNDVQIVIRDKRLKAVTRRPPLIEK